MNHAHRIPTSIFAPGSLPARTIAAMVVAMPGLALAAPGSVDAAGKVNSFFTSITGLLNIASVAIVTIAVIFAGYQIAFNHKRISDVAPVLIGGFLIGAAAQISRMLLADNGGVALEGNGWIGIVGMMC
ncbi:type IV secretion system protein VirB2 [Luteimonas sp. J16]|mgnify:CR=1 FL=1|jgi:type IV secretion system protein VirB2|nr:MULTISPECIES: TrbC/VirB2 family protein [unclassified Luteimonas]TWG94323.1 type IV secretion system protein VirB2 [Luteimonas sp. J16]